MTIKEAMERGLMKLRKEHWAFPDDHLELQRVGTGYGPWATLVSPQTAVALDESYRRQEILILGDEAEDWIEYIEAKA